MRKGISPMVATVLLLAIAVAITGIIGPELISFIKSQAQESTSRSEEEITCSRSGLYIRDAVYNTTSGYLKFKVENTGYESLTDFRLNLIYANDTSGTYKFLGSSETLPTGGIRWFQSEATVDSSFTDLIVYSKTCPSVARDKIYNSSVTWG